MQNAIYKQCKYNIVTRQVNLKTTTKQLITKQAKEAPGDMATAKPLPS